ncbi:ribonuclease H-like domain-containing protein [Tanacetum coccineum]
MDEPTSGLDARAAAIVMRAVRNTVDTGRTADIPADHYYFQAVDGVPKIPEKDNPATWMLEVSSGAAELRLDVDFAEIFSNSTLHQRNKALVKELSVPPPGAADLTFQTQYAQSVWGQFTSCLSNSSDLQTVIGAMYSAIFFIGMSNSQTVQPVVATERTVFYRERAAGLYSSLPYAMAQKIPGWWVWYYWICPMAWTIYGCIVSQYHDVDDTLVVPGMSYDPTIKWFINDYYGYEMDFMGPVAAVLVGFCVLFLSVYYFAFMAGDDSSKKGDSSSSDLNLVFGDPLYLHPNDTNGTPIMTVKLTGTENYKVWSIAMTFALRNHNKIRFINGTCEKDNINPALFNQWDMCNSVVFTWILKILNSLSSDLYAGAIYAKFAYEFWNDLKDTYDKVDGSAAFNLHKIINSLSQNDDNYLAIRSNILTREPLPLVKAAFAIVSGEESHRNISSSGATKPTASVFAAKTFDKKRHTIDRCFEILGYPANYVKRNFIPNSRPVTSNNTIVDPHSNKASSNTTSNSLVSFSNEQLTRLMNLLNDNGVSIANANMSDFVVGNISLGWIIDSGANQHMIVSAKILVNVVDISNLGLTIGHPNRTQALITKIGDLKINNNITLYDVLVVLEYTVSNKILGIGRQFNGLYLFDVDNACKIVSNSCISTCFVSKTFWHQRLVHPPDLVLDALKDSLNLDSHSTLDHLYDTFNKAKQTREPFPLSDHKSSKIGELLSPDINQRNDDSEATYMDETNNTHPEGIIPNETYFITDFYENSEFNYETEELPANTLRRSSRQTKLSSSLNGFIVEGKVKYGVEKVVNYANLNHDNYCFVFALNKSVEPTCYEEAILDSNWIDAMNAEIEALNENHTWVIVDLPANKEIHWK